MDQLIKKKDYTPIYKILYIKMQQSGSLENEVQSPLSRMR